MSEDEPKKPTRRRRRGVAPKVEEPQKPKARTRRRTLPPGVKAVPAWKVIGSRPYAPDPDPDPDPEPEKEG